MFEWLWTMRMSDVAAARDTSCRRVLKAKITGSHDRILQSRPTLTSPGALHTPVLTNPTALLYICGAPLAVVASLEIPSCRQGLEALCQSPQHSAPSFKLRLQLPFIRIVRWRHSALGWP